MFHKNGHSAISGKQKALGYIALALALMMIGSGATIALMNHTYNPSIAYAETPRSSTPLDSPFKAVYAQVSDSVVGITCETTVNLYGRFSQTATSSGSGVVIGENGYVLTNYHVVENADRIVVTSGEDEYEATYIGGDEEMDIAVLQVKNLDLPAVPMGDSDELEVGDWALVIGNPLGQQLANTLTVGTVSGLNREIQSRLSNRTTATNSMIQVDAAINSGNSGGGLFNIRGELVGIPSMKMSSSGYFGIASIEGIGMAIPINTAKEILNDLLTYGKVLRPSLGASLITIDSRSDEPTSRSLPASIWVRSFDTDSPARDAGIQKNDLIMEVDGVRVRSLDALNKIISSHAEGDIIRIKVYRIPNLLNIGSNELIPEGEYFEYDVTVRAVQS